jgi:hypothetical protein
MHQVISKADMKHQSTAERPLIPGHRLMYMRNQMSYQFLASVTR